MARKHHGKHKKGGGRTLEVAAGNPDVIEEAEHPSEHGHEKAKKHGGRAKHHKKAGGAVAHRMTGGAVRPRLDRPGRKRGGGVGADTSPLSTAPHTSSSESLPKEQGGD